MDETVRCIVEEGFAAASAKHIAERAGVTWGVIQYHFGDRNGLLTAVVDAGFDELRARVAVVDLPDGATVDRVTALVEAAWAAFSTPTSLASLEILVATRAHRDRVTTDHLTAMDAELGRLGQDLNAGLHPKAGDTTIGELLWATLRGLVFTQMVSGHAHVPRRELAALVEVIATKLDQDAVTSTGAGIDQ